MKNKREVSAPCPGPRPGGHTSIPISSSPRNQDQPDRSPGDERLEILAVEDSPTQAELLRHLLEQSGYHVTLASTGAQALALLDEHAPSLIITDIIMPEMSGYELCRRIRADERNWDIPVILLTSLSSTEDVLKGLTCGADSFITKPYTKQYLIKNIQEALANRQHDACEHPRVKIQINIAGKAHYVVANQQQMLTLLLSSYEAAVRRNTELCETQEELRTANEKLEERVKERTAALEADITERKRTEQALHDSEEKFRQAFDYAVVGKVLTAPDGRLLRVNAAFSSMLGYSIEELQTFNFADVTHPDDVALSREVVRSVLAGEQRVVRFEKRYIHRSGAVVWADVGTFLLRDPQGKPLHLITHVLDITDRKRAEEAIAQKNARLVELDREKNQLLGMAAHDLRNPLSVVSTASTFLLNDASRNLPEAKRAEFLRRINSVSTFTLKLIDDLLDVAKIEAGRLDLELKEEDLCALIEDSLTLNRILADNKSIRLDFTPERGLPLLRFDRGKIEQVMDNLISNALKFSERDTVVAVRVSRVKGAVVISVRDQGQGIPAEELDRLFEPFSRTSVRSTAGEKSTGLGLAICRKIVEGHGGRIWAESEVGNGTTFSVSLPLAE